MPPISAMCTVSDISNIVLIGFMGAGKSTVGHELAKTGVMDFVDLDELIVRRQGRTIPRIFAEDGEEVFRDYETETLSSLAKKRGLVVATGGGIIGRPQNWTLMRQMGPVVYLRAAWPTLRARISGCTNRPLAGPDRSEEQVVALLRRRQSLYEQADLTVDTDDKTLAEVVEEVWRGIKDRC